MKVKTSLKLFSAQSYHPGVMVNELRVQFHYEIFNILPFNMDPVYKAYSS